MSVYEVHIPTAPPAIEPLIRDLAHADPHVRAHARAALAKQGSTAVASLLAVLHSPTEALRWEAAKTLTQIHDPRAINALICALDDSEQSVRWLAAEGLIAIGPACIRPMLHALITGGNDDWLFKGAHHVLRALCHEVTKPVVKALEGSMPSLEAPLAASHALARLKACA